MGSPKGDEVTATESCRGREALPDDGAVATKRMLVRGRGVENDWVRRGSDVVMMPFEFHAHALGKPVDLQDVSPSPSAVPVLAETLLRTDGRPGDDVLVLER